MPFGNITWQLGKKFFLWQNSVPFKRGIFSSPCQSTSSYYQLTTEEKNFIDGTDERTEGELVIDDLVLIAFLG